MQVHKSRRDRFHGVELCSVVIKMASSAFGVTELMTGDERLVVAIGNRQLWKSVCSKEVLVSQVVYDKLKAHEGVLICTVGNRIRA